MTGGAGFIGSHLVERLLEGGENKVKVIDDLSEGSLDNLSGVMDRIEFSQKSILEALPEEKFDAVYHLAALHSVPKSFDRQQDYYGINIMGSHRVFEQYRDSRIVNISSSSAIECKSPYAVSKKAAELTAQFHSNAVSIRLFNVFGERQADTGCVIPAFCNSMKANRACKIFGDGTQSRDYTYVKDVAAQLEMYGQGDFAQEKGVHETGYGDSISVSNMFNKIKELFGGEVKEPEHCPERQGDVKSTRAKETIENPEYGFEQGMKRTVEWFKAH